MEENSFYKNYPTIARSRLSFSENNLECQISYHNFNKVIIEFDIRQDFNTKDVTRIFKEIKKDKLALIEILQFLAEDNIELLNSAVEIDLEKWVFNYSKIKSNKFFDDYSNELLAQRILYVKNHFERKDNSPIKKKREPVISNVYLMRNNRNGYIKIGYSSNPSYRESTLQSEEPEIELIFSVKTYIDCEIKLHDLFADKRLRGEWFNLTSDDIQKSKEYLLSKEIK